MITLRLELLLRLLEIAINTINFVLFYILSYFLQPFTPKNSNSPYCLPYISHNMASEKLLLGQK